MQNEVSLTLESNAAVVGWGGKAWGDVKDTEAQAQIDAVGPRLQTIPQWSITGHQKHELMGQV